MQISSRTDISIVYFLRQSGHFSRFIQLLIHFGAWRGGGLSISNHSAYTNAQYNRSIALDLTTSNRPYRQTHVMPWFFFLFNLRMSSVQFEGSVCCLSIHFYKRYITLYAISLHHYINLRFSSGINPGANR